MTRLEEKQNDVTGSFTLTCLECEFKDTIWGSPSDNMPNKEVPTHVKPTVKLLNIKKS